MNEAKYTAESKRSMLQEGELQQFRAAVAVFLAGHTGHDKI